jgi:hypothetical protein
LLVCLFCLFFSHNILNYAHKNPIIRRRSPCSYFDVFFKGFDIGSNDERVPEELIAVCIDVSNSMDEANNKEEEIEFEDVVPRIEKGPEEIASMMKSHRYWSVMKEKTLSAQSRAALKSWSYLLFAHEEAIPFALFKNVLEILRKGDSSEERRELLSSMPVCPITG